MAVTETDGTAAVEEVEAEPGTDQVFALIFQTKAELANQIMAALIERGEVNMRVFSPRPDVMPTREDEHKRLADGIAEYVNVLTEGLLGE